MPIFGLRPTNPTTASQCSSTAASKTRSISSCLILRAALVRGQHVVEVTDLRQPDTLVERIARSHPRGPRRREGLAQIEGVGDRIEQRRGGYVALRGVQRAGQLDVGRADLGGERQPFLDGEIRIGFAPFPGCQLLQRRREDAELHGPRPECAAAAAARGRAPGYGWTTACAILSLRNEKRKSTATANANTAG